MFMLTALAAFSSVEFLEGAVAGIALYIANKPAVRRSRTTKK